jgi:hypothetical protein
MKVRQGILEGGRHTKRGGEGALPKTAQDYYVPLYRRRQGFPKFFNYLGLEPKRANVLVSNLPLLQQQ